MEKQNIFLLNQIKQNGVVNELNCSEFWDLNGNGGDLFEPSALSSMVSSPTASDNVGYGGNTVLRDLMGRLGGIICSNNSGELSPHNTSSYSTPLSSPPKLNLLPQQIRGSVNLQSFGRLPPFSTDQGLAERGPRFSCFPDNHIGGVAPSNHHHLQALKIEQISASDRKFNLENCNECGYSMENSTVSEQIPVCKTRNNSHNHSIKRKANARAMGKEHSTQATDASAKKRIKSEKESSNNKSDEEDRKSKDSSKPAEPPKDYIHVRARRGQATDAHSLAERFRREKISERMKFLQDLVPGCNKVTGKAVMVDEIINYVQSLQRQVEFLSMKLSAVNPPITDFGIEGNVSM